ncbi:17707_t:CDS:2, partial [Racocetra fulgida]
NYKWRSALDAFKRAAAAYKKKHKKLPVLVFDNISILNISHPEIIDILQENAKRSADMLEYTIVFITSEGSVLNRMRGNPIVEIGDVTEGEAIDFLVNRHKVCNDAEAKKLYEFIGGRILELHYAAEDIHKKLSFE